MGPSMIGLMCLLMTAEPQVVASRIISASIFRGGLALVTREVSVPAGKASYALDIVPEAIDGGFWYGSPDEGVKVRDVMTRTEWVEKTVDYEPRTIGDFLAANVGKKIRFSIPKGNQGELETIEATLLRMDSPPYGGAYFKLDGNKLRVINPQSITELDMNGLEQTWKRKVKTPHIRIEFEVDAPKAARVRWTTLETGPAWAPSYLLELFPLKEAEMTAKVQLGLPGWTFDQTDVQLLAGKPTVTTDWAADLAAAQGTVNDYLLRSGPKWRNDPPDPLEGFERWQDQLLSYGGQQVGYYGGGFGGGGFGGAFNSDSQFVRTYQDTRSTDFFAREPEINRVGGVYTYPMGKLTMKPGDRLTRVLAKTSGRAQRIVEWRLETNSNRLSDQLEVENTDKLSWTGGRCTVLSDGTPLAMSTVPFTAPGEIAAIKLGDAIDLRWDFRETVAAGESIKLANGATTPTAWHTFALRFTNTRDEPVHLRLVFSRECMELVADGVSSDLIALEQAREPLRRIILSAIVKAGETWEAKVRHRRWGEIGPSGG